MSLLEPAESSVGFYLEQPPPRTIYCSPSLRCFSVAKLAYPEHMIVVDERIQEMNFGTWEQVRWSEIPKAEIDSWTEDIINFTPPKGESFAQVITRVRDFCLEKHHEQSVFLITHSGVLKALRFLENPVVASALVNFDFARPVDFLFDPKTNGLNGLD